VRFEKMPVYIRKVGWMATSKREKPIVDSQGKKTAVVLDIKEYKRILELLEDADDIRYVKERLAEASLPYEAVRKRLAAKK
jgi:hypothetical protein